MNVKYRVTLSDEERSALQALVARGRPKVREVKRAQLLLAADAGTSEAQIARAVGLSPTTIYRTKRAFVEEGLDAALHDATRPGGQRKLSGKEEALLIATACSTPPAGRAQWTLDLLADARGRIAQRWPTAPRVRGARSARGAQNLSAKVKSDANFLRSVDCDPAWEAVCFDIKGQAGAEGAACLAVVMAVQ